MCVFENNAFAFAGYSGLSAADAPQNPLLSFLSSRWLLWLMRWEVFSRVYDAGIREYLTAETELNVFGIVTDHLIQIPSFSVRNS